MELLIIPPLAAIGAIIVYWFLFAKEKHMTIPVLQKPPKGLSVLECGILLDDAINTKDLALEIYNLHLIGLVIKDGHDKYSLNPDYDPKDLDSLTEGQRLIIQTLFDKSGKLNVGRKAHKAEGMSDVAIDFLHKEYLSNLSKKTDPLKLALYEILTKDGYFKTSPFKQRKPFIAFGSMLIGIPLIWNILQALDGETKFILSWYLIGGLVLAGLVFSYSSLFFVRKTEKGSKTKAAILGFKQYIITAEKDRIRFILENDLEGYRKVLPYAAMFDSLDKWIEPLQEFKETFTPHQFKELSEEVSALDVDVMITEKSKFIRAFFDMILYGLSNGIRKNNRKSGN